MPKEWFEIKNIDLIGQKNQSPICPIALQEIVVFNELQSLDLSGNSYPIFPKILCRLINLTTLNLTGCDLEEIPEGVVLIAIRTLDLANNKLSRLPHSLKQSSSLLHLNLSENIFKIKEIRNLLFEENGNTIFKEIKNLSIIQNKISLEEGENLAKELKEKNASENGRIFILYK